MISTPCMLHSALPSPKQVYASLCSACMHLPPVSPAPSHCRFCVHGPISAFNDTQALRQSVTHGMQHSALLSLHAELQVHNHGVMPQARLLAELLQCEDLIDAISADMLLQKAVQICRGGKSSKRRNNLNAGKMQLAFDPFFREAAKHVSGELDENALGQLFDAVDLHQQQCQWDDGAMVHAITVHEVVPAGQVLNIASVSKAIKSVLGKALNHISHNAAGLPSDATNEGVSCARSYCLLGLVFQQLSLENTIWKKLSHYYGQAPYPN